MLELFYKIYREKIYYRYNIIQDIRGTNFLLRKLLVIAELNFPKNDEEPKSIFEEEWDNLLILDGCRHDLYEEVNGQTKFRKSLGSRTMEFLEKTFTDRICQDTVYVSGNPQLSETKMRTFTDMHPQDIFEVVFRTYEDDWDEEEGTVLPQPIIRDATTARELYPDKKLIIHFMQPHAPFVAGELGSDGMGSGQGYLWERARAGQYKKEDIWEAYRTIYNISWTKSRISLKSCQAKRS